jgi:hypothetical protein
VTKTAAAKTSPSYARRLRSARRPPAQIDSMKHRAPDASPEPTLRSIESTPVPCPSRCRFCAAGLTHTLVDLGAAPPAQRFLEPDQLEQMEPLYPLHVRVCERCFLVQLEQFVAPADLFTEYAYFSSYSDSWLAHARSYADMICERLALGKDSLVVELASNDGYLLQYLVAKGVPVLGIEPAANVARAAVAKGIPTMVRFFGDVLARELVASGTRADLVIGNNVLAQVPDLNGFVRGLAILLKPSGTTTLEFAHVLRLLADNEFDTIYHEHFSYFSLFTVERIFAAHGLAVFDVEELGTHGGSLRVYAGHAGSRSHPVSTRLQAARAREHAAGVDRLATYAGFEEPVREVRRALLEFLIGAKRRGKTVAAYGAPAKGNTLLNYCGIRGDMIDYAADRNPYKQGRFLPGTRIPVVSPDVIAATRPDYILILPWNLKHEIMEQLAYVREWGGAFVVPIPRLAVHT